MSGTDETCEYVLDPDDPETWGGEESDTCYVEEDVLNEDGVWNCPHDAEDGEDFCIFHLPRTEKTPEKLFERLDTVLNRSEDNTPNEFIGSKISLSLEDYTVDNESGSSINFKHSSFGIIEINNSRVRKNIELQGSVCYDMFKLYGSKIDSLNVSQMLFGEGLGHNIEDCVFENIVSFAGSEFNGTLEIKTTDFNQRVSFIKTYFNQDINICNSTFEQGVDLWWTTFDSIFEVSKTEFKNLVAFSADFNDSARFSDSEFHTVTFEIGTGLFKGLGLNKAMWQTHVEKGHIPETPSFENLKRRHKSTFNHVVFENVGFNNKTSFRFVEFEKSVVFDECSFNDEVEFRESVAEDSINIKNTTFNKAPVFRQVEFSESRFADLDLSGADMRDAELPNSILNKSDLTDSDLSGAKIRGANLERVVVNRTDLFGTKLHGSAFYGAVFGDAQINEETEFGDRCVYDPKYEGEPAAEIDNDDTGRLTKAAGQYRIIEQLARTNSFPDMVSHNFIRRQDIHREQHRQARRWNRWLRATASKYALEYGENPWRLIVTGLIIVGAFGVLYPLVGGLQPTNGSTITLSRTLDNPILLLQSIYYSTLTFTTLGMGDFLPVGLGRVLTTIETSLGAIVIALLVFVFSRRAAR